MDKLGRLTTVDPSQVLRRAGVGMRGDFTGGEELASAHALGEPAIANGAGAVRRWVAVNTHPHREHIALENLTNQGFDAYCPMVERQVRHARRTRDVRRPLFPGYLFARIDLAGRWRPILSTFGVRSLVRFGDQLSFVEDGLIDGLKAREVDGVIVKPAEPLRPGQQVRVQGGPFDGLVATIIEMDEKDRLVVLMDLLNQSVKVKVPTNRVTAS